MLRYSRWDEKPLERVEMLLASHHFLFTMGHTPPPFGVCLTCSRSQRMNPTDLRDGGGQPCLSDAQNVAIVRTPVSGLKVSKITSATLLSMLSELL